MKDAKQVYKVAKFFPKDVRMEYLLQKPFKNA